MAFRLARYSARFPHLLQSLNKSSQHIATSFFSSTGDSNDENNKQDLSKKVKMEGNNPQTRENGVAELLRKSILSEQDEQDENNLEENERSAVVEDESEEPIGRGRRRRRELNEPQEDDSSDDASLDSEVYYDEEYGIHEYDDLDSKNNKFPWNEEVATMIASELDDQSEGDHSDRLDEDEDSFLDELSEDDESDERPRRGINFECEGYLEALDEAKDLLSANDDQKINFLKRDQRITAQSDGLDQLLRTAFWESLKTDEGIYRTFIPNPAVKRVRLPQPRSLYQLQHALTPKITVDKNSLGYKLGTQAWIAISRNLFYTDSQKYDIANGIALKMNQITEFVKKVEKNKVDTIFHVDFKKGLPYVRKKKGKQLRRKRDLKSFIGCQMLRRNKI